jgi:cytochrome c oxidase subunit III
MAETLDTSSSLPIGSMHDLSSGRWGMWCLIATEASLFAYLLFSYLYLGSQSHGGWVPEIPTLKIALPNTLILIASSFVLYWGESGIRKGKQGRLIAGLGITLVMGIVFASLQALEWHNKKFHISDNAYASSYFTTTGFHMMHVIAGLLMLASLLLWAIMGKFDQERHAAVSIGAIYWHFVDIVWLCVFTLFYLLPYMH